MEVSSGVFILWIEMFFSTVILHNEVYQIGLQETPFV